MRYEILTANRHNGEYITVVSGDMDKARKVACQVAEKGLMEREVFIRHAGMPGWTGYLGSVWKYDYADGKFMYIPDKAGKKPVWNVNPKTGKLTKKIGYKEW